MSVPVRACAFQLSLIAATAIGLLSFVSLVRPAVDLAPGVRASGGPVGATRHIAGPYRAQAIRVVDGDTFEARLRIWFNHDVTLLVRLDGVDAPELRGRCAQERRLALEARDALADILSSGEVTLRDLHADKYNGRAVARAIVTGDGGVADDVGAMLMAGGYARAYNGRARAPWCGSSAVLAGDRRAR